MTSLSTILRILPAFLYLAAAIGGAAQAADVYALTPAQKAEALESGAAARGDALADAGGGPLPIHGEFGALIGTGGTRSVYGTAEIPIGDKGGAAVSFEHSRVGQPPRR